MIMMVSSNGYHGSWGANRGPTPRAIREAIGGDAFTNGSPMTPASVHNQSRTMKQLINQFSTVDRYSISRTPRKHFVYGVGFGATLHEATSVNIKIKIKPNTPHQPLEPIGHSQSSVQPIGQLVYYGPGNHHK